VMAKSNFKSVDEYVASQPVAVHGILGRLRSTIRKAVPEAQEIISYKMPTYTLHGGRLLHFAVWKQHYSIYAATEPVVAAFRDELASYRVDKGAIRFLLSEPVPVKLIGRIAKFRAKEIARREKAKAVVVSPPPGIFRTIGADRNIRRRGSSFPARA
jgi:uncharacterized protein YdhG (YjbR/CyaY superfamily)